MLEGMRVCMTGGAGFIGSHLLQRLIDKNQIVVFDNYHRDALSRLGLGDHKNLSVQKGDVRDATAVAKAVDGADAVIHLASIAGVDTVLKHPVLTMEVSLLGTYNVLEACRKAGTVSRFVDFSTSEVFGRYAYQVSEMDPTTLGAVGEARWTYAVAKLATEHLALNYHKQYGLKTCSIRPFNIYGPGQVGEGAVHHFIVRALAGEALRVHNDGAQIRSWCYIDDIVDAILLCMQKEEAVGHAFNIGNPRSTVTIYNLAREVVRLAQSDSKIDFVKWPHPDVEIRVPSVEHARDKLGYEAKVDLEEGLLRTIEHYRNRGA